MTEQGSKQRALIPLLAAAALCLLYPPAAASGQIVNTAPPEISGTVKPGAYVTASPGSWSETPSALRYRWERCGPVANPCAGIQELESPTYLVRPEDTGRRLRVTVIAIDDEGVWSAPAVSNEVEVERTWRWVVGPPRVEKATWMIKDKPRTPTVRKGTLLRFSVMSGYCDGEPPPVLDHVSVVERPRTKERPYRSALVAAWVRFPAPHEVEGEVLEGGPQPACAGLGYSLSAEVRLRREISKLFIFDAGGPKPQLRLRPSRHRVDGAMRPKDR